MGPSGAGKTTMMDILACRLSTGSGLVIRGDVLVNDKPVNRRLFRRVMCYVMQQDTLPVTETVRECLQFNADLRLPTAMSRHEKAERVEASLAEMGLEGCADVLVGSEVVGVKGISGGQRRRLSVAQELITSPSCIFLDEPTSGLDSDIALTIMQTLQSLAARGRTIVLTIHQPNSDITELFDDFILMAAGHVVYAGPWIEAVSCFARAGYSCPAFKNPTDYFMRVVASDPNAVSALVTQHTARWSSTKRHAFEVAPGGAVEKGAVAVVVNGDSAASPDSNSVTTLKADNDAAEGALAPWPKQALHLTARNMRMWKRHPMMLFGEGVQYIFLGFFVGGMFWDMSSSSETGVFERGAALFFILVTLCFTPPFTAITTYQSERGLIRRETSQHTYSLNAYFAAKTLTVVPMETFFSVLVCVITYFMFGLQRDAGKFFIYTLVLVLTLTVAESIGVLFALITSTADMAVVLMSLIFIVMLSFTGFLTSTIPVYYEWLQYIDFLRYANSALFQNEMSGLTLYDADGAPVSGDDLLKGHPLNSDTSLWANVAILAAMLVFLRVAGIVGLHIAKARNWM